MKRVLLAFSMTWMLGFLGTAYAQAPEAAEAAAQPAPAAPAATVAPAPVPLTDADLKGIEGPKAEDKAKGDPAGTITGTVADIPLGDAKKGLTMADLVNQVGQNKIAINFVWTLIDRLPGHVHAGRLRHRGDRADAAPRTPTTR